MAIKMVKKPKKVAAPTEEVTLSDNVAVTKQEPEPKPVEEAPRQVKAKDRSKEWVEVNMFETIDPSPTVGGFSFTNQMQITILEAKKTYRMPFYVAEVIVDRKKGVILPG